MKSQKGNVLRRIIQVIPLAYIGQAHTHGHLVAQTQFHALLVQIQQHTLATAFAKHPTAVLGRLGRLQQACVEDAAVRRSFQRFDLCLFVDPTPYESDGQTKGGDACPFGRIHAEKA